MANGSHERMAGIFCIMAMPMAAPQARPADAAADGDHQHLGQELLHDVLGPGTEGPADTDLFFPLVHGDEHDVGNDHAPHHQGDRGQ